jgi:hypothetical protein
VRVEREEGVGREGGERKGGYLSVTWIGTYNVTFHLLYHTYHTIPYHTSSSLCKKYLTKVMWLTVSLCWFIPIRPMMMMVHTVSNHVYSLPKFISSEEPPQSPEKRKKKRETTI